MMSRHGNCAAMREALIQCELFLGNVSRHAHPTLNPGDKCTACVGVDELRGMVVRALADAPRNCDVGTPEEQHARFVSYCDGCDCPMGCDHRKNFAGILRPECSSILKCFARWAQLPYEKKEKDSDG